MVFVLGFRMLVLGVLGVYGGRSLVGDQGEIILARDEGQEEDVQRKDQVEYSHLEGNALGECNV